MSEFDMITPEEREQLNRLPPVSKRHDLQHFPVDRFARIVNDILSEVRGLV